MDDSISLEKGLLLQDLPPFHELGKIAEEFDVELTLYGGSASRAVMRLFYRPDDQFDIFDLTPFTSDIDLAHSGDKELTPKIRAAIHDRVPFASWCRWAVTDAQGFAEAAQNMEMGLRVPLREIRFSNKQPFYPDAQVLEDLRSHTVSWHRNPAFADSSYAREGKTIEVFGLLMAMNVVADMQDIAGKGLLRNELEALKWLHSREAILEVRDAQRPPATTLSEDGFQLQRTLSPVASRAWHLTAVRRGRGKFDQLDSAFDRLFDALFFYSGRGAQRARGDFALGQSAISVTRRTVSGEMRVPQTELALTTGHEAEIIVRDRLEKIAQAIGLTEIPQIDPAYEVIAVFHDITVKQTSKDRAEEERDSGDYASVPSGEFIQLAWSNAGGQKPQGITGFYLPAGDNPAMIARMMTQPAALAVGGMFDAEQCWLRVDLEGLAYRDRGVINDPVIDVIALAPRQRRQDSSKNSSPWDLSTGGGAFRQDDLGRSTGKTA
jgi:hypothetical protein